MRSACEKHEHFMWFDLLSRPEITYEDSSKRFHRNHSNMSVVLGFRMWDTIFWFIFIIIWDLSRLIGDLWYSSEPFSTKTCLIWLRLTYICKEKTRTRRFAISNEFKYKRVVQRTIGCLLFHFTYFNHFLIFWNKMIERSKSAVHGPP